MTKKRLSIKRAFKGIKRKVINLFKFIISLVKQIVALPVTIFQFIKGVKHELKLVEWLNASRTTKWTSAIFITALFIGGLIILIDLIFFN